MDNEIRLIKKDKESSQPKQEVPIFKRRENVITSNSPIIKRLREAEERNRNRKELSDDELIELEFKEEADKIRANREKNDEVVIKTSKIKNENFNLDFIKDDDHIYDSVYCKDSNDLGFSENLIDQKSKEIHKEILQRIPLHKHFKRDSNLDIVLKRNDANQNKDLSIENTNIVESVESNQNLKTNILSDRLARDFKYTFQEKQDSNQLVKNIDLGDKKNVIAISQNSINDINLDSSNHDFTNSSNNANAESSHINAQNDSLSNITDCMQDSKNGNFVLPPTTLLNMPIHQKIDIDGSEIDLKANNLISKLRVFKINGDIADIYSGPVVTTFEFRPAPDVKVSRIQSLQDDLSMALKAKSIRIQAPIPGKDVVGIEIPNNIIQTIYIREVFESDEFINSKANLAIALGKDIIGKPVIQDLASLPHLLIAGTTGSGKSVGLNGMILSLLYKKTPNELRFIMIDPKRVELSLYKDIPHLLTPIIADSKKAVIALGKAVDEMNRRYEIMNEAGVKNIIGYNEIASSNNLEPLPYIVVIIDEFADLMIMGGRDAEQYLISLASKARASGIHLIIATQRPTVNVVTGLIKSNLPSKISYRVGTQMDSKVILDRTGAESLLGNGDMLFSNTNAITRFHAPYSHEKEIERVADFIRAQQSVEYDEFFSLEPKDLIQPPQNIPNNMLNSEEEYVKRAKEIMLQSQKTSISYLQRSLGIGFNKASNIVELLEREGFLSAPNSKGLREIVG